MLMRSIFAISCHTRVNLTFMLFIKTRVFLGYRVNLTYILFIKTRVFGGFRYVCDKRLYTYNAY